MAQGVIYAPSKGVTALATKANGAEPEQVWSAKAINPSTISPLVLGDRLYTINSAGVIATATVADGKPGWKLRVTGPFSGSPVGAGGRLVLVSENGLVQIVDVSAPPGAGRTGRWLFEVCGCLRQGRLHHGLLACVECHM